MDDFTKEVVRQIAAGDTQKAKESIEGILATKIQDSLENKKQEVAQNFFGGITTQEFPTN